MEISQVFRDFKGGKGGQVRGEGGGTKRVALQMSLATCRHPGVMGLFPGLLGREDGNSALSETRYWTRTRILVLCPQEVIRL